MPSRDPCEGGVPPEDLRVGRDRDHRIHVHRGRGCRFQVGRNVHGRIHRMKEGRRHRIRAGKGAGVGRPRLPRGIAVLATGIGSEGVKGKGRGGGAMVHLPARSESQAEGRRSVEEVRRRGEDE